MGQLDQAWGVALQTFATSGNWGGVQKGVRHIKTYGTSWGGYALIEVDDPEAFGRYQQHHYQNYGHVARVTFEPVADLDAGVRADAGGDQEQGQAVSQHGRRSVDGSEPDHARSGSRVDAGLLRLPRGVDALEDGEHLAQPFTGVFAVSCRATPKVHPPPRGKRLGFVERQRVAGGRCLRLPRAALRRVSSPTSFLPNPVVADLQPPAILGDNSHNLCR